MNGTREDDGTNHNQSLGKSELRYYFIRLTILNIHIALFIFLLCIMYWMKINLELELFVACIHDNQ